MVMNDSQSPERSDEIEDRLRRDSVYPDGSLKLGYAIPLAFLSPRDPQDEVGSEAK